MDTTAASNPTTIRHTVKGPAGFVNVDDGGRGGIPVVFVHSFGGNSSQWQEQLNHLRTGRRAIAVDLRGHGSSDTPVNNDYAVESLAKDIEAAVDSLHLDKFILVGHSFGGSAVIAYAGKHPGKVAGLFVTGTPGKTPAEQSAPIIQSLESPQYEKVMEDYMKKMLANAKPETERSEREGMNRLSKQASINIIKAVFEYDPLPAMKIYKGPKMIVSNSKEDQPNSLHATFPDIPYKTIEGASHWSQMDKPAEFNKILDEFLAEIER